ncbi:MAG TPA: hypothetical protein VJ975_10145, partial [Candidatus Limnocylindria bacterium]|nr:hypothetical protein [Candidatus Limnocylindria bacterium]
MTRAEWKFVQPAARYAAVSANRWPREREPGRIGRIGSITDGTERKISRGSSATGRTADISAP